LDEFSIWNVIQKHTRSDYFRQVPLLWTAKSTSAFAAELTSMGYPISDRSVATLLNHIGMNRRGRALEAREIEVNLIGETTTKSGLKIRAALDEWIDPTGIKITDEKMRNLNLKRDEFQPAWNHTITTMNIPIIAIAFLQ